MRFKSGFDECAAEVTRYIGRMGNVDDGVKQRLIAHLHRCVNSLQQVSVFPQQNMYTPQNCDKSTIVLPSISTLPGDVNNNSNQTAERIHIPGGLQLIPSRLPTGELALLVPNSNQISSFLNAPPPPANLQFQSVLSPNFGNKGPSAFTAVSKSVESPTESKTVGGEFAGVPFSSGFERREDTVEQKYSYGKFKNLVQKPAEPPDRVPVVSSSFQKKAADSTSGVHVKEEEKFTTCFKPFQVDIPNSQIKAHISMPGYFDEKIQQKPNPNFTLNPNKAKSPQKFVRSHVAPDNSLSGKFGLGFEKFSKIEPLSVITDNGDYSGRPRSTETFQQIQPSAKYRASESPPRPAKRPLSAGSSSHSPTSTESPSKVSRISLNFTVTDEYAKDAMDDQCNDRCQRISVIVEDVSKDAKDGNDVGVSGSSHRDMWRPW
ncbi:UNVERIFIED_CONTAM: hypothetical protein PYX00_010344 [Menopon gallinae]|uniref:Orange domain-containing protein n=1 Tax=Menopon gallinae TaxID=328185 RepID=A0AAW2HFU4_9NEOP